LGVPGLPGKVHPLSDPRRFYLTTQNQWAPPPARPDSFILIGAGPDGLYGTADDIHSFAWRYRQD
jgi:hypothetical protein